MLLWRIVNAHHHEHLLSSVVVPQLGNRRADAVGCVDVGLVLLQHLPVRVQRPGRVLLGLCCVLRLQRVVLSNIYNLSLALIARCEKNTSASRAARKSTIVYWRCTLEHPRKLERPRKASCYTYPGSAAMDWTALRRHLNDQHTGHNDEGELTGGCAGPPWWPTFLRLEGMEVSVSEAMPSQP